MDTCAAIPDCFPTRNTARNLVVELILPSSGPYSCRPNPPKEIHLRDIPISINRVDPLAIVPVIIACSPPIKYLPLYDRQSRITFQSFFEHKVTGGAVATLRIPSEHALKVYIIPKESIYIILHIPLPYNGAFNLAFWNHLTLFCFLKN
jgi:hypothetical protein